MLSSHAEHQCTNIMMPALIICWSINWSLEKMLSDQDQKGEKDVAKSFALRIIYIFSILFAT